MRCLYTAVAKGRADHVFQGLRDENYVTGDVLNVEAEKWRVDEVQDVETAIGRGPKAHQFHRTLYCTVV
jgi:hypothetical protein